ncbi:cytochrome P450 [Aaosphaeria arxii CBS 175.79]|uniref:Cytochrome P450 n=1 Tax=Aaosphaeria arxii CBS 175.79 TaxID=1450172 RepID=A0A6A5X814_9PLEO|nr:cytochrome P450 [Aaosphaeria arxii CBS 175.79]KAF2009046.1 cytochrome P450 [Aaosphaeria arxii CBS 175.79]
MLPYSFPGHALAFLRNSEEVLATGKKYFGCTNHPFALNLGGSIFYAIFNPVDVAAVFNAGPKLSFDGFLHGIMAEFGSSQTAIQKVLNVPDESQLGLSPRQSVSELAHHFQVKQTSGSELKLLIQHIVCFFQENLLLEGLKNHTSPSFYVDCDGEKCVSLKYWTAEVFIHAGQNAYFGDELLKIDPTLPQVLMRMDELSWQIFYRYPWFLRPELNRLTSRLRSTLHQYLKLPKHQRKSVAWFTQFLESEYRRVGLDDEDIAAQMLFLYWGINTNVSKVGYWMMAHIAFDPSLAEIVREETEPAFQEDESLDVEYLANACPRLNCLWLEVLRLSASSTTLRYITEDQELGNYLLRKGRALMISARQLHHDETAFGEDAHLFKPDRFLKSPKLQRSYCFRPFGGGKTLCPGRHLAKWMVLSFIAIVFRRYDVDLAKPQKFPRYQENKPAIGIISGCDDVFLRLKARK